MMEKTKALKVVVLYFAEHPGSALILNKLIQAPKYEVAGVVKAHALNFSRQNRQKLNWKTPLIPWLLIFFASLLPTGCAHLQIQPPRSLEVARGVTLKLVPPAALKTAKPITITQHIRIQHAGESHEALAQIEIDAASLALVGMTPSSQYLFSITYRDNLWHYEVGPLAAERIQPEYLLADVQLSYWPLEILQQHLAGGRIIEEKMSATQGRRTVYRDGEKLIEIEYERAGPWQGRIGFKHLERSYSVTAETLAIEEL